MLAISLKPKARSVPDSEARHRKRRADFEWTDNDGEEPLKFAMTLSGKQEADLRFVTTPDGVKVKPFHFTRTN